MKNYVEIAIFGDLLGYKRNLPQNNQKTAIFCNSENEIEKISWFSWKSYATGERIRIFKDPSIFTDPDPFGQNSTDLDPDPNNPGSNT